MTPRRFRRCALGMLGTLLLAVGASGTAGAAAPLDNPGGGSVTSHGSGSDGSVRVSATDGQGGVTVPRGGHIDQGTGSPTLFECDIFYLGPDGRVWTPWNCVPDNPLVADGVIYHGSGDLPPLNQAPFVQTMIREMHLSAPEVASTPNDPATKGAVGLPVWFWVANPGPSTTGPNSVTATAGAMSVTATGTLSELIIETGDGTTLTCPGGGTPYPGTGVEPSPDCGHTYEKTSESQPGGVYDVKVTARWQIAWTDNLGHASEMTMELDGQKQLAIGQLEAVRNSGGPGTGAR